MATKKRKKVKFEIERKFLLRNVPDFSKKIWTYLDIRQFYFSENGERIRYRESIDVSGKATYFSTKKKFISKGTNSEDEFEITEKIFWDRFKKTRNKIGIRKQRFVYSYAGHKFEIDRFADIYIVVMEVELKNINENINFPDFIKSLIISEVTEIEGFGNFKLSSKIKKWEKKNVL
jgi:CYTH domain-containing protein